MPAVRTQRLAPKPIAAAGPGIQPAMAQQINQPAATHQPANNNAYRAWLGHCRGLRSRNRRLEVFGREMMYIEEVEQLLHRGSARTRRKIPLVDDQMELNDWISLQQALRAQEVQRTAASLESADASGLPMGMPMPLPQGSESLPTRSNGIQHPFFYDSYLQGAALGVQPPSPHYQETFRSIPQVPVGIPQHADFLQKQGSGYQNTPLQGLPAPMTGSQLPFGIGQSAEGLLVGNQQFNTALYSPGPTLLLLLLLLPGAVDCLKTSSPSSSTLLELLCLL
ncbi:hypothetical protein E8E12_010152 [Didymella heteroderae]|uniref:Uncharacterized protein n=1 Tax=Didymella heteroderae TaxID=1769908 RepID=A0A9P4WYW5_9PLEO|nr:hypothetical protein E8E12_010152 [Didymella heteroderae]